MKVLLGPVRFLASLLLAVLIFSLSIAVLFSGFVAVYLPMWETAGLDEGALEGVWMWIDDQPIYYRTWGTPDAPTVVLIHDDVVEGSILWQGSAAMLADSGLFVIAIDLPGYGHSVRGAEPSDSFRTQAGVVARLLNELRATDATLVGLGRGSGVVLQLAVEQPQFVKNMVLVSPDIDSQPGALWRGIVRMPYIGQAAVWALESGGPFWKWERTQLVADPGALSTDYFSSAILPTHIVGTAQTRRMMALSAPDDNLPEAIPGLAMPALVLIGDQDRTLSTAQAQELASQFADAQVVVIPQAGHAAQIDQPELVNDQIIDFAGGQVAPRP